ncbi:MAG: Cyclic dehypoxanthine futalosine synthase [Planctomycetes bacterium]|nr:Cyclic dehypoxanthine futalosine synthase [Planctomycetota bacterium]
MHDELDRILRDVAAGSRRLTPEECARLYDEADLVALGAAAHAVRCRVNDPAVVTYNVDRNINYSNICDSYCGFCSFYAPPGSKDGYLLTRATIRRKIEETKALGGRQILMQGGTHPEWDVAWYADLLRFCKSLGVHVHALSAPEIQAIAKVSKLPVRETIARLRDAGLDSIPGGGAEVLTDFARNAISPMKCTADQWIEVHREAHALGMRTTATMMMGHKERTADRVEHLERLRSLQDESLRNAGGADAGFTAFISWTFQPTNALKRMEPVGSAEYLRNVAVARLYLDNIRHHQSSWVTQGPKVGQAALWFGCDDMGSTMIEENVVSSAGTVFKMTSPELCSLIRAAGFRPQQRNFFYEPVEALFLDAPDRKLAVVGDRPENDALPREAFEAAGVTAR